MATVSLFTTDELKALRKFMFNINVDNSPFEGMNEDEKFLVTRVYIKLESALETIERMENRNVR